MRILDGVPGWLVASNFHRLRDELEIQERRRMERLQALEMEKRQAGNRMNQHMYLDGAQSGVQPCC